MVITNQFYEKKIQNGANMQASQIITFRYQMHFFDDFVDLIVVENQNFRAMMPLKNVWLEKLFKQQGEHTLCIITTIPSRSSYIKTKLLRIASSSNAPPK